MTILETREVKSARKPWRCSGCNRKFEVGTPKSRSRIVGDDGPFTWCECPTCKEIVHHLFTTGEYSDEGVTEDDIHEFVYWMFRKEGEEWNSKAVLMERADAFLLAGKKFSEVQDAEA